MNLDHLRTFLAVVETRNFNRAAEHLNVTQSTVSARIMALEDTVDRPLFTRSHAGAELTAAGRQFRRYALSMIRLWQQVEQESALPEGFNALFGLGAQVSLWERLVLKWMPWMRHQAPQVALHVEADYSDSLMRQLTDGLLDVGVMYAPRRLPGLVTEELLVERLVMVSTRRREFTREWQHDYIFVDWGPEFQVQHGDAFPAIGMPAVTVGLGQVGLQYILDNGGAGYFPARLVRPLLAAKRLYRVPKAPVFRRPAYMVYLADPPDPDLQSLALAGLRSIAVEETERPTAGTVAADRRDAAGPPPTSRQQRQGHDRWPQSAK